MILRQFLHTEPVAASYLFGCGGRAAAAVVDPVGDIAPYLQAAEETGMRIRYVIDTHLHADHISAGRSTRAKLPAPTYVLFAGADVTFPFHGVRDGEILELGNVTIKVLHTPGHTPEHISLLVTDRTRSRRAMVRTDRPHAHGRRSRPHRACNQRRRRRARLVPQRASGSRRCPTI